MSLCINPTCNYQNTDNLHFCENCGSELLLNGKYRVIKQIGQGGFGRTYEIRSQHETHVLKVLIKDSPKAVELFDREAKVLQEINHSGIVKATDKFLYPPKNAPTPLHCLVMEKIEGCNLREYIEQKGSPIDGEQALKWLKELLTTLNEVHKQGILHRDIKPDNIILDPFHNLVLIDFGAIKEIAIKEGTQGVTQTEGVTESVTATNTTLISFGYTAHEVMEGGTATVQSDIYSLGCTFVYLLTRKKPLTEVRRNWQSYASNVSPQLASIINSMIKLDSSDRPDSCQRILDQFLTEVVQENQETNSFYDEINEDITQEAKAINHKAYREYKDKYSKSHKSYSLGVSIGLVESSASIYKDGHVINLVKIPSIVAYTNQGDCLVGEDAKQQEHFNPNNTFVNFLYFIDQSYDYIKKFKIQTPYQLTRGKNGEVLLKCPAINQYISPEELLIELIYKILHQATEKSGFYFNKIVLALPSFLMKIDFQKTFFTGDGYSTNFTGSIEKLIGTYIQRRQNETLMYSLASSFNNGHLYSSYRLYLIAVVYDFFLDVSLHEVDDGVVEKVFCYRKYFISGRLNTPDGEELIIEAIEHCLKINKIDNVDVMIIPSHSSQFSAMKAIYDSRVNNRIQEIIWSQNITANGCAMAAGVLAGEVKDLLLLENTNSAIGIWTKQGFVEILPQNTTIPTKKSESFLYQTNLSQITIPIVEKENEEYKRVLSIIDVYDINSSNKMSVMEITSDIDANGTLNVVAIDKISGKEYNICRHVESYFTSREILVDGIYDNQLLLPTIKGEAIWHGYGDDSPVKVEGFLGIENGDIYVKIEGSETGIKLDEIEFIDSKY